MKRRILCFMIVLIPMLSHSQGIQWVKDLSWKQVKQKARQENKYIFIDVYATWCGPCKVMDRSIYPLAEVGKAYNEKFISVRVQADPSTKDGEEIKSWYEDARKISAEYNVAAYPTFLFFSPTGELVHRASGGFSSEKFIALANDAINNNGYTNSIKLFKNGQYENLNLKELAFSAQYAGDDSLSKEIATVYVDRLDLTELLTQESLFFIFQFGEKDKKWARDVSMPKISKLSLNQLANVHAIRFLIFAAKNDSLAAKATDYWLNKMTDTQIFNKDTLEYVRMFLFQTTDKSFQLLYNNAARVDGIMGKRNWTVDALSHVVIKEEFFIPIFNPVVKAINGGMNRDVPTEPDWKLLSKKIELRYGVTYAQWLQFSPKISWYNLTANKKDYITNLLAEMDRTGGWALNGMLLNNYCMEVFRYSTSKTELNKAAAWMGKYYKKNTKEIATDASGLDTYATLLYKAGQIKEALKWEEKAAKIDPNISEIASNLAKMKKGLSVWPPGYDVVNK
jgi:thioredoxin-related protein